jgi:hypothetical protein
MYQVYVTKSLTSTSEFVNLNRVYPRTFRDEINGTGVATLRVDTKNFNDDDENLQDKINPGDWVFILRDADENTPEETPMTEVLDSRVVWWGYISSTQLEISKAFFTEIGDIQANQFGHYLSLFTIQYDTEFEQGFNPQIDGWTLGNRQENNIRKTELGWKPIEQGATHYWTVKQALEFIVNNGTNLSLDIDYSGIVLDNSFLNLVETLPSYVGQSLNQALDEIVSPYGWTFIFISTSAVTIKLIDKTASSNATQKKVFNIVDGIASVNITDEERKYDAVVLEGERIQVNFSVTTYHHPDDPVGIGPNFDELDILEYVTPKTSTTVQHIDSATQLTFKGVPIYKLQDYVLDYFTTDLKPGQADTVKEALVNTAIQNVFNDLESARRQDKNTYQRYKWLFSNQDGTSDGNWLNTYERPGDYDPGDVIPVFPEVIFQDYSNIEENLEDSFYAEPYILNGSNKAPTPSEFKFADRLLVDYASELYIEPTFYYRTTTPMVVEINDQFYYPPCWYEATLQRSNGISWRMTPDWYGIRIESPYPEALGCGEDDLVSDPYGGSDFNEPVWHYLHDEWNIEENNEVTPSNYDPHYFQRTKYGIGTWQRMIFSLGAYSGQRMTVRAGKISGERQKVVRDDTFQFIINRKGFVYKFTDTYVDETFTTQKPPTIQNHPVWTNNFTGSTYLAGNEIVKSDIKEMKARLNQLWDYYSKDKVAVRIESRINDENGNEIDYGLKIGDFITKIKEFNKEKNTNSHIASIEYQVDGLNPRIIISTEYPTSPVRTRERVVKSRI